MTEQLNEVKLSRVYQHFITPGYPVGIITAFRADHTYKENVRRNYLLSHAIRDAGFGFIWVDGVFDEKQEDGTMKKVNEVSMLVLGDKSDHGELEKFLAKLCGAANQDSFLFKDATCNTGLINREGQATMHFKDIKMDQLAEIYSRLRYGPHAGRVFHFESARTPASIILRMIGKEHYYDNPSKIPDSLL